MRTQQVIERFVYEGLLVHNQYVGRRWRITVQDVREAGKSEPRLLELLPAVLMLCPTMMYRWKRDLKQHPDLAVLIKNFDTLPADYQWRNVPVADLRKAAWQVAEKLAMRRKHQRWRNLNLRVSESDLAALHQLARKRQMSKSEVVRRLIAEA